MKSISMRTKVLAGAILVVIGLGGAEILSVWKRQSQMAGLVNYAESLREGQVAFFSEYGFYADSLDQLGMSHVPDIYSVYFSPDAVPLSIRTVIPDSGWSMEGGSGFWILVGEHEGYQKNFIRAASLTNEETIREYEFD